jgi:ferredoxin
MPWVDKNKCIGCGICLRECPVNAIFLEGGKAEIDMEKCIRCGKCHDVCLQEAVRHDSEKIPLEIRKNLEEIEKLAENFRDKEEKRALLERMIKYYNKEKMVAEGTIKEINKKLK